MPLKFNSYLDLEVGLTALTFIRDTICKTILWVLSLGPVHESTVEDVMPDYSFVSYRPESLRDSDLCKVTAHPVTVDLRTIG